MFGDSSIKNPKDIAEKFIDQWKHSPKHNANMLLDNVNNAATVVS